MPKPSDLLQGTAREPLHGWGVAKRIQLLSGDVPAVGQGSLWKDSDPGRPAKLYSLTLAGRKQLERELQSWIRLFSAVQLLIQNA